MSTSRPQVSRLECLRRRLWATLLPLRWSGQECPCAQTKAHAALVSQLAALKISRTKSRLRYCVPMRCAAPAGTKRSLLQPPNYNSGNESAIHANLPINNGLSRIMINSCILVKHPFSESRLLAQVDLRDRCIREHVHCRSESLCDSGTNRSPNPTQAVTQRRHATVSAEGSGNGQWKLRSADHLRTEDPGPFPARSAKECTGSTETNGAVYEPAALRTQNVLI